jgi:1,4-dihydroxy-2-naphthoate octaprenyltransferase
VWDWNAVIAGMPYALGATTVIFGKHIDKFAADRDKGIYTLPVLLGERLARYTAIGMMALQYLLTIYLVAIGYFTPALLLVLLALTSVPLVWGVYRQPKPAERPEQYPADSWPLWFVAFAFLHNRRFGLLFLAGLLVDLLLRSVIG